MKMKKMIGAFALTAALAMGTAPAFAAGTEADNAFSDNGSTEVKAKVDNVNPQVRATVPLQITVVFGATGASDITGPSSDTYAITNIGEGNIKVTEAELTDMNTTFNSMAIMDDGSGNWIDGNGDAVTGNAIMFTYTTAGNKTYLTTDHPLSQAKSIATDTQFVTGGKKFTEETIAVGGKLAIELAGKCYFNDTLASGELTDTLCKIKYTIAAA